MTRKCPSCGKEYELSQWSFDKGACPECPRPFPFMDLHWSNPTPQGTRAVWKSVVFLHIVGAAVCIFMLGLVLCDTSFLSIPLVVYAATVVGYIAVRSSVAAFRGYPILTPGQRAALYLLPLYGLPITFVLFYLGQGMRYGFK